MGKRIASKIKEVQLSGQGTSSVQQTKLRWIMLLKTRREMINCPQPESPWQEGLRSGNRHWNMERGLGLIFLIEKNQAGSCSNDWNKNIPTEVKGNKGCSLEKKLRSVTNSGFETEVTLDFLKLLVVFRGPQSQG